MPKEACTIEIERCGKPIGKQDQYIAAYGGVHEFEYHADETVSERRLTMQPADLRRLSMELMLFYTNITRQSSDVLTVQRSNTLANIAFLRQIKNGVPQIANAIEARRFDVIGDVLHHGWGLKKKLADNMSNPEIDNMYELALSAGATGGKIAGAGGGGFLLLHVPREPSGRGPQRVTRTSRVPMVDRA